MREFNLESIFAHCSTPECALWGHADMLAYSLPHVLSLSPSPCLVGGPIPPCQQPLAALTRRSQVVQTSTAAQAARILTRGQRTRDLWDLWAPGDEGR